jgi:cysteine desulfurase
VSIKDATYLDVNAGALVHPKVAQGLLSLLQDNLLGSNPSSIHALGRRSHRLIVEAKKKVALSLGAAETSLTFTSSGTEANQLAIRSILESQIRLKMKAHWITTPVEHDCNLSMIEWFKGLGGEVSFLPVDAQGSPIVSELRSILKPETALVSVIWVNNETGVVTDVEALSAVCKQAGVPLHLDGAQAWGKITVDLNRLSEQGVTYACFASHKIGAPSGTGVLWKKKEAPLARRGGTENVLGVVATGIAASLIDLSTQKEIAERRDRLQRLIVSNIPQVVVNGALAPRVAGTLNLCFDGVSRDGFVAALDLEGYAVSSGSACASGIERTSHVLLALGRTPEQAQAAIRISFGSEISWQALEGFAAALEKVVNRVRSNYATNATLSI